MGKFKEYLLNEDLGLGNLGTKMDNIVNSQWLDTQLGGAIMCSDQTGTDQFPPFERTGSYAKPDLDLTVPSVVRSGRITNLFLKKNPIHIGLSDGTQLRLNYDEFKRIQGKPEIGKVMNVTLQRHPSDNSQTHSRIDKIEVRD